jgi:hypothetical protein
MTSLNRFVESHYGAIEADWRRYYGRSLKQDLWGVNYIGVREISHMVKWLPSEAAVWRDAGTSWSTENELQATTVEMLDAILRVYIQAHSKPNSKKPKPIKIPRPYEKQEKKRTSIGEMLANGLTVKKIKNEGGDK